MIATPKPRTDELAISDADRNRRDALIILDNLEELEYSKTSMVDELVFNFGYTPRQADDVYQDWKRQVA